MFRLLLPGATPMLALAGDRWLLAETLAIVTTILFAFFYRAVTARMRTLFRFAHDTLSTLRSISKSLFVPLAGTKIYWPQHRFQSWADASSGTEKHFM